MLQGTLPDEGFCLQTPKISSRGCFFLVPSLQMTSSSLIVFPLTLPPRAGGDGTFSVRLTEERDGGGNLPLGSHANADHLLHLGLFIGLFIAHASQYFSFLSSHMAALLRAVPPWPSPHPSTARLLTDGISPGKLPDKWCQMEPRHHHRHHRHSLEFPFSSAPCSIIYI